MDQRRSRLLREPEYRALAEIVDAAMKVAEGGPQRCFVVVLKPGRPPWSPVGAPEAAMGLQEVPGDEPGLVEHSFTIPPRVNVSDHRMNPNGDG